MRTEISSVSLNAKSPVKINEAEIGEISSIFVASRLRQQLHLNEILRSLTHACPIYKTGYF